MRLGQFIRSNSELILQGWEDYILTSVPDEEIRGAELRDLVQQMLIAIATDIEQPQGNADPLARLSGYLLRPHSDKYAGRHGSNRRHSSGYSVMDAVSVFRAVRASVTKLWADPDRTFSHTDLHDLVRFHDSVDQALSMTVSRFLETNDTGGVVASSRNIPERKQTEEQVWQSANYDVLTGLPSRRLLLDRLQQDVKHSSRYCLPLAVLCIDLDGFGAFNEDMGHRVGDQILRKVAQRLVQNIRKADTAARLGGDEFAVVLTDLHKDRDMQTVAEKISDALNISYEAKQGGTAYITASIGVTLCPQDGTAADDLLKHADKAMHKARSSKQLKVCYYGSARTKGTKFESLHRLSVG